MSKVILFALVALMAATLVMAKTADNAPSTCLRHGDPCVSASQCCKGMRCNAYAHRCQVIITAEELQAQREKIFSKNKNKNKPPVEAA